MTPPADDRADDERLFSERGFGRIIGFGQSPALLVIDLVRGFTDPALPLGAPLDDVLAATRQLLGACRKRGVPVFFTSVAYEEQDLADAGIWAKKMAGLMTLRAGMPEVEVDPRLGRRDDEPLLYKKYASAFFGTDLLTRLNTRRVDTLLRAGCTTSGCVRATAVDGVQHGLRVMVPREAVGDRAQAPHVQSLFDLHAKYADVIGLADALTYLDERT
ncbi:N-carbamoylsarcosine amidohydrolase [soil metagenome]